MKKIDFNKFFLRKNKTGSLETTRVYSTNPVRDWRIILSVFSIGMVFLFIFAWQIFTSDKIGGGYFSSETGAINTLVFNIDEKRLQADFLIFQTKQADFLELKARQSKLVDPSL